MEKQMGTKKNIEDKRQHEKRILELMVRIYCKGKKHKPNGKGICEACESLVGYEN